MASSPGDFECWLAERLNAAGIDGEVFSGYISGTLSSLEDPSPDETQESLVEILQGCVEEEAVSLSLSKEIQKHWNEEKKRRATAKTAEVPEPTVLVDSGSPKVTKDLEKEPRAGLKEGGLTDEEKRKLIEQYDCESDDDDPQSSHSENTGGVYMNCNTSVSEEAQRLHREKLKAEHEAKVERDHRDRDVQKQRAQERKEKEKKRTQKQEKRR